MSEEMNVEEINYETIITNDSTTIIEEPVIITTEEPIFTKNDDVSTLKLKPYRITKYDEQDKTYATHMKYMYQNVDTNIKEQFDIFTENLLDDEYISRNNLLDAIQEFTKQNDNKVSCRSWGRFDDEAFNCRPYQPCCIS